MDELVARIAEATGLRPDVAARAAGLVLAFLQTEAPGEAVATLIASLPGAAEAVASAAADPIASGSPAGMGVMALAGQLSEAGLSMQDMTGLAHAFFASAAQAAGEDTVGSIVAAVPGLGQYI
ncbi:MAG: DUF2267 domain-containing protein [Alsobacter sp.]